MKKKSQQTCNRRELLRWSKGHLQMQNKAETAHSEWATYSRATVIHNDGKSSALHLSELNFCKEQKSCRLCVCVCVYTHVCENVHACTRQKSSVNTFFDCFPFYILRHGFSLNLEFTDWTPSILSSLPSPPLPTAGIAGVHYLAW